MNLITDPWIPIRRRDGSEERIEPWRLTEGLNGGASPPFAFASPRADFDGALAQFLIALLQTALAPEDALEWRERFDQPPTPDELRDAFAPYTRGPYERAFELLGDGPRFEQDLTILEDKPGEESIAKLLVETPGNSTLKKGTDHFVHGGRVEALCHPCAAAALWTLQINAPSGGVGHRTGLRGGGPLTTLVVSEKSLWHSLWLNVLDPEWFGQDFERSAPDTPDARFPWLAPTRTSEKSGTMTHTTETHPLQLYWSMPRRIRLLEEDDGDATGTCDLCNDTGPVLRRYATKNYGVCYAGPWVHPLSPHRRPKAGDLPIPLHGSPAGLSYTQYLGLVCRDRDEGRFPARVVDQAQNEDERSEALEDLGETVRLWAFGHDFDNMKARSWNEGTFPWIAAPAHPERFELDTQALVRGAQQARLYLYQALKQALGADGAPSGAQDALLRQTESSFYRALHEIREVLVAQPADLEAVDIEKATEDIRERWRRSLREAALDLYDRYAPMDTSGATDPGHIVRTRQALSRNFHGKKLRDLLRVPKPPTKQKRTEAA